MCVCWHQLACVGRLPCVAGASRTPDGACAGQRAYVLHTARRLAWGRLAGSVTGGASGCPGAVGEAEDAAPRGTAVAALGGKPDGIAALQVLPVERGAGLAQPGMRAAEARLAHGDWLHIFPEARPAPLRGALVGWGQAGARPRGACGRLARRRAAARQRRLGLCLEWRERGVG